MMRTIRRRPGPGAGRAAGPTEPVLIRIRAKGREFFVRNEIDAFAVIARHDVDDVDFIGGE